MNGTAIVSEIFTSVQGEGRALGIPMTFVRLAHCNIECIWCDTPQRKAGTQTPLMKIASTVQTAGVEDVCFTGGEPMLQFPRISPLLVALAEGGWKLHLETNGTIRPSKHTSLLEMFTVITVSPKLPSAQHPDPRTPLERKPVFDQSVFREWANYSETNAAVSFKYVLEDGDREWAALHDQLCELPATAEVFIQPQSYQPDAYKRFGDRILSNIADGWPYRGMPPVRYAPRFHELMWGDSPGR